MLITLFLQYIMYVYQALITAGWNRRCNPETPNTFENRNVVRYKSKNIHKNILSLKWAEK